jgi:mRNA interferase MazF
VAGLGRFDVLLVNLEPTVGSEIRKTRPCVVVSPDELNDALRTLSVAPLTAHGHAYACRVPARLAGTAGRIALNPQTRRRLLAALAELFAP